MLINNILLKTINLKKKTLTSFEAEELQTDCKMRWKRQVNNNFDYFVKWHTCIKILKNKTNCIHLLLFGCTESKVKQFKRTHKTSLACNIF